MNESIKFGTWLTAGSPVLVELASLYNFDWFLFDMEHGFLTQNDLLSNLQAVKNQNTNAIVRVGGIDPIQISKVLDLGAQGVMVPHVSNVGDAKKCVEAVCYPPLGHRGFSSSVRAFNYGLNVPKDINENSPLLFVQIEDLEGVKNVDEIAAVEGVDVLFVGPADLKLSLSFQRTDNPVTYEEALERVMITVKKYGKQAGILIRDYNDIPELIKMGFSYVALSSDIAILKSGYQQVVNIIQSVKK